MSKRSTENQRLREVKQLLQADLPASLVVFLVALPLCLGIAQASGANPIAGVVAGVIGGIVVGALSGSVIGVSGPAAGLAGIIITFMMELQDYRVFLLVVVLSGVIQVFLSAIRAGVVAAYFPFNVIKGMLAAIGLLLLLKQIPHGLGYDSDPIGDMAFKQVDGGNTFNQILNALESPHFGAITLTFLSIALMIFWQSSLIQRQEYIRRLPSPLLVVILGIVFNELFIHFIADFALKDNHLVNIPVYDSLGSFYKNLPSPDFAYLYEIVFNWDKDAVYQLFSMALTISVVSSLSCLLALEAIDKLDPLKRVSPTDQELKAQGIGNIIAGLLGGLPIAQVVIRSAANVNAGAKSKASTIIHGLLLLISVMVIPKYINLIPKASLAAILLVIGYKLTNFKLFLNMYELHRREFWPFLVTILAMLLTNILVGILIGLIVSVYFILQTNRRYEPFDVHFKRIKDGDKRYLVDFTLYREVTYLSKNIFLKSLHDIPANSIVNIHGSESRFISEDVIETIKEFEEGLAEERNIEFHFIRKLRRHQLTEEKQLKTQTV